MEFLGFEAKNHGGGGGGWGWFNYQENSRKDGPLRVFAFLGEYFNLTKFHPNRRDGMYHVCLVLSWTQS